jgi:hypothetical protein
MMPFQASDIQRLVSAFSRELCCTPREIEGSPAYSFSIGDKIVEFLWPQYAPEELWIALFGSRANFEARNADFVMFEEPTTKAGQLEILGFFEIVAWRYLRSQTRIRRRWILLGPKSLQFHTGAEWRDIYADD